MRFRVSLSVALVAMLAAPLALAKKPTATRSTKKSEKKAASKPNAAADAGVALDVGALPAPVSFSWDIPGVISAVEVPGQQVTNGIPVKFDAFLSSWRMEDLANHFVDSFGKAGLYVPPPQDQMRVEGMVQVTAIDPGKLVSYTVILRPTENDQTVVIAAQAALQGWNPHPEVADIAPVMPGAEGVVRSQSEGMRSFSYKVKATEEEVVGFYRSVMRANGFEEKEPGVFRKAAEEISVNQSEEGTGTRGVMVMRRGTLAEEEPPPPVAPNSAP